jgi:hypothetical protein
VFLVHRRFGSRTSFWSARMEKVSTSALSAAPILESSDSLSEIALPTGLSAEKHREREQGDCHHQLVHEILHGFVSSRSAQSINCL